MDAPRELFPLVRFPGPTYVYDVTPDGQRLLVLQPPGAGGEDAAALTVVSNWQAGLKQ